MTREPAPSPPPAEFGFRLPAEWEPHQATWFSWPHNEETWPDELERVEAVLVQAITAIAAGEDIFINVLDEAHQWHVSRLLRGAIDPNRAKFFRIPTNDAWVRDHGPIFLSRAAGTATEIVATIWRFNSWGRKYPPWDMDDRAARLMADAIGVPSIDGEIVLEGGSIESNGAGVLITTEACLLNPNREREWPRDEVASHLQRFLGARHVIWLGDGIVGDDTDGHVDDLARFVAEHVVVTTTEFDPIDPNYEVLQENMRRLERARLPDGSGIRLVRLPSPRPLYVRGERMPASYANFYICNAAVLVPVFNDPADEDALKVLGRLFPTRRVVPFDSREVIWGLGAIHCLTQQIPRGIPARLPVRARS